MIIYGKHPCFLGLKNNKVKVFEVYVVKKQQQDLEDFLVSQKINFKSLKITVCDNRYLDNLVGGGSLHQGLAMKIAEKSLTSFDDFIDRLPEKKPNLLILDSLTDVNNIGAIIRSAVAFGVVDIIVARNFPIDSPVIFKASSGLAFEVNLIAAVNLNNVVKALKKCDYWVVGLDGSAKDDVKLISKYQPCALVAGSEGRGISNLLKKNCDLLVKINIDTKVESLNVSNACAIALNYLKNN
jgi:23S rRNA (guanosine2251-2'-O)-methyltransferase